MVSWKSKINETKTKQNDKE